MANFTGNFVRGTTGLMTISSLGFDPTRIKLTVGAKNNNSSNFTLCLGSVDSAGNENCQTSYNNNSTRTFRTYTDRCIQVWEHDGTNWLEVITASFDSWVTGGFKLNFTNASSNYDIFVDADDS